jgi:hypothetical protein
MNYLYFVGGGGPRNLRHFSNYKINECYKLGSLYYNILDDSHQSESESVEVRESSMWPGVEDNLRDFSESGSSEDDVMDSSSKKLDSYQQIGLNMRSNKEDSLKSYLA